MIERALVRRRRLVAAAAVVLAAAVTAGAAAVSSRGRHVHGIPATLPAAKLLPAMHAQPSSAPESTVAAPAPTAAIAPIPASIAPASAVAVPLSPALVRVRNVWLVSNGRTLVAVYAGAAGDDSSDGRFVIVRQNLRAGTQRERLVTLAGAGAVAIDGAPTGAAVETSAQKATLHFHSESGRSGTISLAQDRPLWR